VDEIKVEGNRVCVRGSHATLAADIAKTKLGTFPLIVDRVPSFGSVWLPMLDANEQTLCELYKMNYAISKRCNRRRLQEVSFDFKKMKLSQTSG
jgi:hypothetical protein